LQKKDIEDLCKFKDKNIEDFKQFVNFLKEV